MSIEITDDETLLMWQQYVAAFGLHPLPIPPILFHTFLQLFFLLTMIIHLHYVPFSFFCLTLDFPKDTACKCANQ